MSGGEAPDNIPQDFLTRQRDAGFSGGKLRDAPFAVTGSRKETMRKEVDRIIAYIKTQVVPAL
jgi:hypothetical protein